MEESAKGVSFGRLNDASSGEGVDGGVGCVSDAGLGERNSDFQADDAADSNIPAVGWIYSGAGRGK